MMKLENAETAAHAAGRPETGADDGSLSQADIIYMNHAATAYRRPACVGEAVLAALHSMGNEFRGTSVREMQTARTVWHCREELAALFHFSHPERVVLTANATTAMNMVLLGSFAPGDTVLATDWDHNCVLRPLHVLSEQEVRVVFWQADREGRLHTEDLEMLLQEEEKRGSRPKAIVCTHASNLTGQRLDPAAVSRIAHAHGAELILDASQTAGALPIDMEADGIDILVFTGHKSLMGPQGTGGMCVRPGWEIRPLISGGTGFLSFEPAQPEAWPAHLEAGTLNGHGIAGLKAAVEFIQKTGTETIHQREMQLAAQFLKGIRDIPGIRTYGWEDFPMTSGHMPVVALNIGELSSAEVADILSERYGIATRGGAHCAPRMHRALGTQTQGAVRFSFGWFNTEEEIDAAVRALAELSAVIK